MSTRYLTSVGVPQPIRKIIPASTDILHPFKLGERLDQLANKYYGDPTLSWVIMYGNPQYMNEFEIERGDTVRIPFPIQRIFDAWGMVNEI